MAQMTPAMLDMIDAHIAKQEMPPLTLWEMQQLAYQARSYQNLMRAIADLRGNVKPGEGYPEGFDAENSLAPSYAVRLANTVGAGVIGDREWDVRFIAAAINTPLVQLHRELNKMRWAGEDDGWDNAIAAVRAYIADITTPGGTEFPLGS